MAYDPSSGDYLMAGGTSGWNGTSVENYWLNDVWRVNNDGDWSIVTPLSDDHWAGRQNPGFAATSQIALLAGGEAKKGNTGE